MKELSVRVADRAAKRHGIIKAKVAFISATAQWLGCMSEESTLDLLITQCKDILCDKDRVVTDESTSSDEQPSILAKDGE